MSAKIASAKVDLENGCLSVGRFYQDVPGTAMFRYVDRDDQNGTHRFTMKSICGGEREEVIIAEDQLKLLRPISDDRVKAKPGGRFSVQVRAGQQYWPMPEYTVA
jgi:hypothetical protein